LFLTLLEVRYADGGSEVYVMPMAFLGGPAAEELAREHGTPLYVYDEDELRERCGEYVAAFGADAVAYSGKAFLCGAMARLVAEEGLLLDVATGGEARLALQAGFPPGRLVLHGNAKSVSELRLALERGIGRIVVDEHMQSSDPAGGALRAVFESGGHVSPILQPWTALPRRRRSP
jgi:diaminopimelate decarboxylase